MATWGCLSGLGEHQPLQCSGALTGGNLGPPSGVNEHCLGRVGCSCTTAWAQALLPYCFFSAWRSGRHFPGAAEHTVLCCIIALLRPCLHDAGSTSPRWPRHVQLLQPSCRCCLIRMLSLPVFCRDTYPNQHLEIHVRLYVYRWNSVNELGAPQVCLTATALTAAPPRCSISSLTVTGLCAEALRAAQATCFCAGCVCCHAHMQDQLSAGCLTSRAPSMLVSPDGWMTSPS